MSFLKKITSALNSENRFQIKKSNSCSNVDSDCGNGKSKIQTLEEFLADNFQQYGLNNASTLDWQRRSQLSKTTREVLHDPPALAYFIQYLEARDAVQLVKFWLDVESFNSSASNVISSKFIPRNTSVTKFGIQLDTLVEDSNFESYSDAKDVETCSINFEDSFDNKDEDNNCNKEPVSTVQHPEQAISRAEILCKSRTEDAVKIYHRYIAPDCMRPVYLPTELKKNIVERICAESGQVAANCFTEAQEKVVQILEIDYFPDFLKSEYHAKHLVDILTGGQVMISDIVFNETALSHFMEFMETQSKLSLMEFVLSAINFHQSIKCETSQADAMVLYEKYFSMQASSPLGFDDSVRLQIENNICSNGGPYHSCFDLPLEIILQYLETNFLQKFLISPMFKNYVKELIGTITASPRSLSRVTGSNIKTSCGGSTLSRESDEPSDCDSEYSCSNLNNNMSPSTTNTLLAMSSVLSHSADAESSPPVSPEASSENIWRRTPVRNDIARISSLGRYQPGWELAPDSCKNQGTKPSSRLSVAVKKLVTNEEHEKMKEEMAWQVAEMFIKEVTSVTLSDQGQVSEQARTPMNKSYSESYSLVADSNLDLDSEELPSAKYF